MTDNILTRSVRVTAVDTDTRTLTGVAVPWDEVARVTDNGFDYYLEKFARGSVEWHEDVKLFDEHGELIGRVQSAKDTDEGWEISARISETSRGNDVYALTKDKAKTGLSIGFAEREHRTEASDAGDVIVRTKVHPIEVSTGTFPSYTGAKISAVRTADRREGKDAPDMGDENKDQTFARAEDVQNLERTLRVDLEKAIEGVATKPDKDTIATGFRSGGEFLKALAARSVTPEQIAAHNRAFTGATTGDANAKDAWVNKELQLVEENRKIWNFFNSEPLPPTGNNVDFPEVESTSGTVGVQANEGDDLPYMEVVIGEGSRPVKTYGGYSSLSRQAIERSNVAYLNTVRRYQALQYAKTTNSAARAAMTGAAGANAVTVEDDTAAAWIMAVIESVAAIEANSMGLSAEGIITGLSGFQAIASIVDGNGRPVFVINGDGSNSIGSANLRSLTFNIAGLPGMVDPRYTGDNVFVASPGAVTTMESPGAPHNLDDENIINLTKDFSLYGYAAVGASDEKGIAKLTLPAAV